MAFDFTTLNPFAVKVTPAAATTTTTTTTPPAKTVAADPNAPGNKGTATLPNDANNASAPPDPLAPFAKMYDTSTEATTAPQFALDDTALATAAKSLNIMHGVDPALMQKATSGDTSALIQLIEHAGRAAYQTALAHSSALTGKFTDAREAYNNKDFSGRVRGELTVNALTNAPNFSHPVVRKELIKVAQDIQRQHPDASPQDVADRAKEYITELSRAINPVNTDSASNKAAPKDTNWDKFFLTEDAAQ